MKDKKIKLKIDKEKCKGCLLCIHVCPQKVLEASKEVNKKGLKYVVLKDSQKCTKCALCALMCPDCAIELLEEGK
jgi:2-oxoglutarate ferredoxin oxidoreductase subunit delta